MTDDGYPQGKGGKKERIGPRDYDGDAEKGDRKGDWKGDRKGDSKGDKGDRKGDRKGDGKGDRKGDGKGKKGDGKNRQEKVVAKGLRGKVVLFMKDKPSGFIQRVDGDRDVYFDFSDVLGDEQLELMDPVEFDVVEGTDMRLYGARIKKLPKDIDLKEDGLVLKSTAPQMASKAGLLTGGSLTSLGPVSLGGGRLTGGKLTGAVSLRPGAGALAPGGSLSGGLSSKAKEKEEPPSTADGPPDDNCCWGRIVSVRGNFGFLQRLGSGGDGADIFFRADNVIGMNSTDPGDDGMEINLPHVRNSNGFKKIFLAVDDEVSFVMSKDHLGKPCAAEVMKERKGAWRTGRRGGPPKAALKQVTLKDKVKQLLAMDPDQILQNASLFKEILDSPNFDPELLYKIVPMLASKGLCEDTRSDRLYRLFLDSPAMQACLRTTIIKQGAGKHRGNFLEDCLNLLFEIVIRSHNPQELRGQLPLAELVDAYEHSVKGGSSVARGGLPEDVVQMLTCLQKNFPEEVSLEHVLGAKAPKVQRSAAEEYTELLEADHYQEMPILPTSAEMIGQCAFEVQENMRTYESCEDYVQTHFMLLREDYIEPLRAGIKLFFQKKHSPKDLHVYTGVKVIGVLSTWEGLVYRIELRHEQISRINWEKSKQLMYGSLLCFSDDDFDSLIWATVWRRDEHLIANKGQLDVRLPFEPYDDRLEPGKVFCCIENVTIYFEAYRHVLVALQNMRPTDVPFQTTLLTPQPPPAPPTFLKAESDMFHFHNVFSSCEKVDCPIAAPKSFKILQEWPEALRQTLDLDPSQLDAIQHALTHQVALIQGPPGTGKTFVGLKIVQALLENTSSVRHSPILVVCYTNHALDQFLEGIFKFCERIARIGSRSKSEQLKARNLKELVAEYIPSKEYLQARKALMERRDLLREQLAKALGDVDKHTVAPADVKGIMTESQFERFYEGYLEYMCGDTEDLPEDAWEVDDEVWARMMKAWLQTKSSSELAKLAPVIKKEAGGLPTMDKLGYFDDDDASPCSPSGKGKDDDEEEEEADFQKHDRKLDVEVEEPQRKKSQMDFFQELKYAWLPTKEEHFERLHPDLRSFDWREENLWHIPLPLRQETYRQWLLEAHHEARQVLPELARLLERNADHRAALERDRKLAVLREMEVVGMTTTAVSKYQQLLKELRPEVVIVEEAAEVLEAHILTALHARTQHVVLIGDHQQLRPSTAVYRLSKNFHLDVSLFERLIHNEAAHVTLLQQRRMHPKISRLIKPLYPLLRDHHSTEQYPEVMGVAARCFFMKHYHWEDDEGESHSKQNTFEANFISALCAHLVKSGYEDSRITVLSPYLGQVRILKQKLRRDVSTYNIPVMAVDNFQGEENDIIIVSLVRSNRKKQMGFVAVENRINVALTRARHGMFIVGNADMLDKHTLWSQIMNELATDECISDTLPLIDDGTIFQVKTADEIGVLLGNDIYETGGEGMITLDEYKNSKLGKQSRSGGKGKGKGDAVAERWAELGNGNAKGAGKGKREYRDKDSGDGARRKGKQANSGSYDLQEPMDSWEAIATDDLPGLQDSKSKKSKSSSTAAPAVEYRPPPSKLEADGVECELIQKKGGDEDEETTKKGGNKKKQKQKQVLLKLSG